MEMDSGMLSPIGNVGHRLEMWVTDWECGSPIGNVGHRLGMWITDWECGSPIGNVEHSLRINQARRRRCTFLNFVQARSETRKPRKVIFRCFLSEFSSAA